MEITTFHSANSDTENQVSHPVNHNHHAYDNHAYHNGVHSNGAQGGPEHHTPSSKEGGSRGRDGGGEGPRVVLVGSGDMTRALVVNLVRVGYRPVVATRNPARARTWMSSKEVEVRRVEEALALADLVILAIPAEHHATLPHHLLYNKILVDISNRAPDNPVGELSLAEKLQDLLPESHVVKALNTMSAYVLQRGDLHGGREVPVCGESEWARARVATLVKDMGLTPRDMGGLKNARALEDLPFSFFPEWKVAVIIGGIIYCFFWLLELFTRQICRNLESNVAWDWGKFETLPLDNTQIALAYTACALLILCYLPGLMAAYLQLWRGSKYTQFPAWLDNWMKARKQMGLMALLQGATHGCMSIFSKIRWGQEAVWWQSTYIACGALLLAVLSILGITSLPSVSAKLTWKEFSVTQRYLGWTSVILVTAHMTLCSLNSLARPPSCVILLSGSQIMVPLCFLTLLLKLPLLLPCVDWHLTKIRRGYERPPRRPRQDAGLVA